MRIAFMTEELKGLESKISSRFGRATYIIIVDYENSEVKNVKELENPGAAARSGAAIKAIQKLIEEKVEKVVAGAFGPNAMAALEEVGIKRVEISGITIREALEKI